MCYTECWSKAAIGSVLFFTDTHTRTNTQTKWHSQHVLCSTVWYGREHSIDNWFQTSLVDSQCNFLDAELAKCGFFEFGTYVWLPQLMNKDNVSCHIWQHCTILHNRKIPGFSIQRIQFKNSIQRLLGCSMATARVPITCIRTCTAMSPSNAKVQSNANAADILKSSKSRNTMQKMGTYQWSWLF